MVRRSERDLESWGEGDDDDGDGSIDGATIPPPLRRPRSRPRRSTRCEGVRGSRVYGLALCSDCNAFAEYVKDEELVSDCRKCCSEDSDDSISKVTFSGAILEVCMRKLVFYPEVASFIEEEKDDFPYLKIQYAFTSPPKLIMLDSNSHHTETIRIDNWKREHIRQFLREKVKPGAAEI
uniref:Selenoprotein F n=1 Tax=Ananas comosus var. bracteatus TaxID=296719 RepID=A0A6V7PN04_ANACO|nr:unnamed protein product [Ananas comosus var. bracteatus]